MVLHSYAKLNLYLEVLNIRKDNYHNIKTIFERISLSDKIILKPRPDRKIKIICNAPGIPKDCSRNLAYRSAKLLQDTFNIDKGAYIKVIKRIPVAAGLGGGSSNAAAVLIGLNKLWRLNLSQKKLLYYAKNIGSDVPFFIYNSPFAQGNERGNRIRPLNSLNNIRLWHVLVVPKNKVSTARIYKKWDSRGHLTGLTIPKYDVKILNLALRKKDFTLLGEALFNSLEQVTTKLYPQVRHIKERLLHLGMKSILMSGSGPAVFGIVSSRKEALSLCRQLKAELKRKNRSWQVFTAKTR